MLFKVSHDIQDRRMFSCVLVWCFLMTLYSFVFESRNRQTLLN